MGRHTSSGGPAPSIPSAGDSERRGRRGGAARPADDHGREILEQVLARAASTVRWLGERLRAPRGRSLRLYLLAYHAGGWDATLHATAQLQPVFEGDVRIVSAVMRDAHGSDALMATPTAG